MERGEDRPISPCKRICKLNDEGMCVGCGRTVEEVMAWPLMSDSERLEVMDVLDERLKDVENRATPV